MGRGGRGEVILGVSIGISGGGVGSISMGIVTKEVRTDWTFFFFVLGDSLFEELEFLRFRLVFVFSLRLLCFCCDGAFAFLFGFLFFWKYPRMSSFSFYIGVGHLSSI